MHYFLLTLKLLQKRKAPTYSTWSSLQDETLLKPPSVGGGPLREALWKTVHAQDEALTRPSRLSWKGDPCFGGVDATFYALCRKLVETRAFQLSTDATTRVDSAGLGAGHGPRQLFQGLRHSSNHHGRLYRVAGDVYLYKVRFVGTTVDRRKHLWTS